VNNESARPAELVVMDTSAVNGPAVGTAQPPVVTPHTRVAVVFTVPDTSTWGIVVNPPVDENKSGPVIVAWEVDECVDVLPIEIRVEADGAASYDVPRNWCGDNAP
jgi:hypothetical protein